MTSKTDLMYLKTIYDISEKAHKGNKALKLSNAFPR